MSTDSIQENIPSIIVHMKLINGDEILGEFVGETKKREYLIRNPLLVVEQFDMNTGNLGLVLNSYVWFEKKSEVLFKKQHIISVVPVFNELIDLYYNSVEYNSQYVVDGVLQNVVSASNHLVKTLSTHTSSVHGATLITTNHPGSNTVN